MNKIKINGVKRIIGFNNSIEIKTDFNYINKTSEIIILSEEDILNDNMVIKLRGIAIACLFIPKKFKNSFSEQKIYDLIIPQLTKNSVISYY